jgi:hypothetical protein
MSWRGVLLAALLLASNAAQAHSRGSSYSFWTLTADGAEVRARVPQLELTRLQLHPQQPDYLQASAKLLSEQLQLWSATSACTPSPASARAGDDGWLEARWSLHCDDRQSLTLRTHLFADVAPTHLHFARATLTDGQIRERVLTLAEPAFVLTEPVPVISHSLFRYLLLGIEHILSGWDHLAFVLGLILLAGSLREIALIATGFTLAHSLTLALAVLSLVQPISSVVEAMIGFSIMLVAAENLWLRSGRERWLPFTLVAALIAMALFGFSSMPSVLLLGLALFCACYFPLLAQISRPARLRLSLAFVFGLVHGFGFAGALAELKLPTERLALGLVGFNLGVETGQLLVIALVWPLLWQLSRWRSARQWANDGGAAFICALGTYWFVARSFA